MRPAKELSADIATTTPGTIDKYIAANDNVPQDESGVSAGFGVSNVMNSPSNGGRVATAVPYLGLVLDADGTVRAFGQQAAPPPTRKGDWMQTYSGRKFWPLDPRPEEVHIEDIAHSLSLQCRYAGHCIRFYSVAEHSVHIARWLDKNYGALTALHGLLHDATEAYLVDMPRPVKADMPWYKAMEQRVWRQAVAPAFELAELLPAAVHEADNRIIGDELVNLRPMEWHARHNDHLGVLIGCWSPDAAEDEFLAEYVRLMRKLGRAK